MIIYNFPTSPTDNQTHTYNGRVYTFSQADLAWYSPTVSNDTDPALISAEAIGGGVRVVFNVQELAVDMQWAQVRHIRDIKINEIEWRYNRYARLARLNLTQIDSITDLDSYVQALADITLQSSPTDVSWPTMP